MCYMNLIQPYHNDVRSKIKNTISDGLPFKRSRGTRRSAFRPLAFFGYFLWRQKVTKKNLFLRFLLQLLCNLVLFVFFQQPFCDFQGFFFLSF